MNNKESNTLIGVLLDVSGSMKDKYNLKDKINETKKID
jgi:hypothetical protein